MNKNTSIIIGVIVVLLIMMFAKAPAEPKEAPAETQMKKEATAGLEATRVWSGGSGPNHVIAGQTIMATYDNIAAAYMGVVEVAPAGGWTVSPVTASPDGKYRFTTDFGTDFMMTWTAPATTGNYVFDEGLYFVTPDEAWTLFDSDTINVCDNHGYSQCVGGDRYWYTSAPCNDQQDLREACTPNPCESYGSDYCDVLIIKHDRTCYTEGCAADICTNTGYTDTEVLTGAPNSASGVCAWQCTSGACDQNTAGDINYDGCVSDTELPTNVADWKGAQSYITDPVFPSVVSNWKSQVNC